jgi:hypothetical protein
MGWTLEAVEVVEPKDSMARLDLHAKATKKPLISFISHTQLI